MIQAAEANIVGPSVTPECPDRFFHENIGTGVYAVQKSATAGLGKDLLELIAIGSGGICIISPFEPSVDAFLQCIG